MSGAAIAILGVAGYTPTSRAYTSGSGAETVPTGPRQVIIEGWSGSGAGVGGSLNPPVPNGSCSGAYFRKTIALTSTDWGKTFNYSVGAGGATSGAEWTAGSPGGDTTVTNGTASHVVSLLAHGSVAATNSTPGTPPTATGGDVNTPGNAPSGGYSISATPITGIGGDVAGAGGLGRLAGAGYSGYPGMVKFWYS